MLEQSFQDGCDIIVSGCTTYGSTPSSNSPTDIVNAIKNIYDNRYTAGENNVKNNPGSYGLYTSSQYSSYGTSQYNAGRTQGQNDVKNNPSAYGLYVAPKSLSGSVGVDPVPAGVTVSRTVTFSSAFATVPNVNASANGIYKNEWYALTVTVTSRTRSGFTVSIKNPLGSARLSSITLSWNAVA